MRLIVVDGRVKSDIAGVLRPVVSNEMLSAARQ